MDLRAVGQGRLAATVPEGWDVRGIPHGGYLLAVAAAAAATEVDQPDPVSIAATYLAPPQFGTVDLTVEVVRAGRRQSTALVMMSQDGRSLVQSSVTFSQLKPAEDSTGPSALTPDTEAPEIPPVEDCLQFATGPDQEPIGLRERLDIRLSPDTGFIRNEPSGVPVLTGWARLRSGIDQPHVDPDLLGLLVLSDGFPPSMFEALGVTGYHVPTIQLTTHVFGHPAPGWMRCRCRTTVRGDGYIDEDTDLWDSQGRPVATARQLALLR